MVMMTSTSSFFLLPSRRDHFRPVETADRYSERFRTWGSTKVSGVRQYLETLCTQ